MHVDFEDVVLVAFVSISFAACDAFNNAWEHYGRSTSSVQWNFAKSDKGEQQLTVAILTFGTPTENQRFQSKLKDEGSHGQNIMFVRSTEWCNFCWGSHFLPDGAHYNLKLELATYFSCIFSWPLADLFISAKPEKAHFLTITNLTTTWTAN